MPHTRFAVLPLSVFPDVFMISAVVLYFAGAVLTMVATSCKGKTPPKEPTFTNAKNAA